MSLSPTKILLEIQNLNNNRLYLDIKRILTERKLYAQKYNKLLKDITYLRNILICNGLEYKTSVDLHNELEEIKIDDYNNEQDTLETFKSEKDNLIKQTELEKQQLLEEAEYLRLKENKELRESVNRLTSENSKLKRKLKRESNTK